MWKINLQLETHENARSFSFECCPSRRIVVIHTQLFLYFLSDWYRMLNQLQRCESERVSENMGISLDLRGCQYGAADMADHKSNSADRVTGSTVGFAMQGFRQ